MPAAKTHEERLRRPGRRLGTLLLALAAPACLAPPPGDGEEPPVGTPWAPTPADPVDDSIGAFLMDLDASLRYWSNLRLAGTGTGDARTLRLLESELTHRTTKRKQELLSALESPSAVNRQIAAIGLGFTRDPAVTGALLDALSDPRERVVNNALVGLGILGEPSTPLPKLCFLLRNHPEPWTRNNAAFAIQSIVAAGGRDECVVDACRMALIDAEPGVRAQAATVLGAVVDVDSLRDLGDLLLDQVRLVSAAAAWSLARIGREEPHAKAAVARILVDSLARVEDRYEGHVLGALETLSREGFGDDVELWTEWAYRLQ